MRTLTALMLVCLATAACGGSAGQTVTLTPINQLVTHPDQYVGQSVTVEGRVTKSLGEKSYMLLFFYPQMYPCKIGKMSSMCTRLMPSFSQVRVGTFEFSDGEQTIILTERTGGMYLPIPIVPAGSPQLPEGRLRITGTWTKDNQGNYQLHVGSTESVATPTPAA